MKKYIILALLTLIISMVDTQAQDIIIPIENSYRYIGTMGGYLGNNDSVYVKDINNKLDEFEGNWMGSANKKNYKFIVKKSTTNRGPIKKDKLVLKYEITDDRGNTIVSTLGLNDENPLVMDNGYMNESGTWVFHYSGFNTKCGQSGSIFFNLSEPNPGSAYLFLFADGEIWPTCESDYAEQVFPQDWMTITKS